LKRLEIPARGRTRGSERPPNQARSPSLSGSSPRIGDALGRPLPPRSENARPLPPRLQTSPEFLRVPSTTGSRSRSRVSIRYGWNDVRIKTMLEERMIVIDPEVMNGMPCFRGTRVPFRILIDYLEGGHSEPQRMNDPKSLYQSPAGPCGAVFTQSFRR
jgi:hypothetical protein